MFPLDEFLSRDPESFARIRDAFAYWDDVAIHYKGHEIRCAGNGFAGISRGNEQWTVRASRELAEDPTKTAVGPLTYEVVEPLTKVRARLDKNDVLPLTFDVTFEKRLPPYFEDRHAQRVSIRRHVSREGG